MKDIINKEIERLFKACKPLLEELLNNRIELSDIDVNKIEGCIDKLSDMTEGEFNRFDMMHVIKLRQLYELLQIDYSEYSDQNKLERFVKRLELDDTEINNINKIRKEFSDLNLNQNTLYLISSKLYAINNWNWIPRILVISCNHRKTLDNIENIIERLLVYKVKIYDFKKLPLQDNILYKLFGNTNFYVHHNKNRKSLRGFIPYRMAYEPILWDDFKIDENIIFIFKNVQDIGNKLEFEIRNIDKRRFWDYLIEIRNDTYKKITLEKRVGNIKNFKLERKEKNSNRCKFILFTSENISEIKKIIQNDTLFFPEYIEFP